MSILCHTNKWVQACHLNTWHHLVASNAVKMQNEFIFCQYLNSKQKNLSNRLFKEILQRNKKYIRCKFFFIYLQTWGQFTCQTFGCNQLPEYTRKSLQKAINYSCLEEITHKSLGIIFNVEFFDLKFVSTSSVELWPPRILRPVTPIV